MKFKTVLLWSLAALCPMSMAHAFTAYLSGNSVTDEVKYPALAGLATSRGRTLTLARHSIPGSSIKFRWQNPNSGFTTNPYGSFPNAAVNFDWDALVLQPFDSLLPDDTSFGGLHIAALDGRPANSDTPVFIYARYPKKRALSFTEQWNVTYRAGDFTTVDGRDYFEQLRAVWASNHPGHPVRIIPVGHVFHELDVRMRAGLIPGYDSIYDLYTWSVNPGDNVHVEDTGSYVVACTFFAVLLGESPLGLPHAEYAGVTPEFAAAVQDAVWDVVTTTPHTGVSAEPGPVEISTLLLPPALIGQPYEAALQAVKGVPPYVWRVVDGTPPDGLSLAADGRISGTPTLAGRSTWRVEVSAGGLAEAEFTLVVEEDSAPSITTLALPAGRLGERYVQVLEAEGGNAPLSWAKLSGELPPGLELQADGLLVGSPERAGFFRVTLGLTDGDRSGAEQSSRDFVLAVGMAAPGTLAIRSATGPIVADGILSERDWVLDQRIERLVLGVAGEQAVFGALWDASALHLALRVTDPQRVEDSTELWEDDSVEIFVDARNDRENVYNADDRRIVLRADGQVAGVGDLSGIVWQTSVEGAVRTTEISIPWTNLGVGARPGRGVGLDVAVNDDDDGGSRDRRIFWRGDAQAETLPQFGTAFLQPGAASGHLEAGGLLVIEAEAYASATVGGDGVAAWRPVDSPGGFSGTGAMGTPDAGVTTASFASGARLAYPIFITNPGDYVVWLRRSGPDGDSNSVFVGLNGAVAGDAVLDNGTPSANWVWHRAQATVALGAGAQLLELRHREDGYGVDRLVLARDAAFAPASVNGGLGPPASAFRAEADPGYAGWAAQLEWSGAEAGPSADPDGDGAENFWEYALGGDPILPGPGGRPSLETESDGLPALVYWPARDEFSYTVERSEDLVSWSTDGMSVENAGAGVGARVRVVTAPAGGRVFLRLRVRAAE
jgi:hypothetical protein